MQDAKLLALFQSRDETALKEAEMRFGTQCRGIAKRILGNNEDAKECWNDVLLRLWNSIPPAKPDYLAAYVCTMTRNAALDMLDTQKATRRGGAQVTAALDELSDCLSAPDDIPTQVEARQDAELINQMLDTLSPDARRFFVLRYVYLLPVREIAKNCECSVSRVKVSLLRARRKLKDLLEGII